MKTHKGASLTSVKKMIARYRALSNNQDDPCVARIAQGMESALIWATQETHGWSRYMRDEPDLLAAFLRCELQKKKL